MSALILTVFLAGQAAGGEPPPYERGEALLFNGKDDVATYTQAIAAFDEAIKAQPTSSMAYARKAEAYLRMGDITADKEKKKSLYASGRDTAKSGIAVDAKCSRCHFWFAANAGRWGQVRGVLESLFLLDDVKGAFETALKLDPTYLDAKLSLGKIDEAVPGFAGGSVERAEKIFREVVKKDPHFTRAMLDLAELLAREDHEDEAKQWATKALNDSAPTFPGEHRKYDIARAKKLLAELGK
jgi:tetratricopeptide (TPR) repeat protein